VLRRIEYSEELHVESVSTSHYLLKQSQQTPSNLNT